MLPPVVSDVASGKGATPTRSESTHTALRRPGSDGALPGARSAVPPSTRCARALVVLLLDRLELGFGRVSFANDPVQGVEEVVDARSGRLGDVIPHGLVDLARALAPQQPFRIVLVQANH